MLAFAVVLCRKKGFSRTNEDLVKEPAGRVHDVGTPIVYTDQAMESNTEQSLEVDVQHMLREVMDGCDLPA